MGSINVIWIDICTVPLNRTQFFFYGFLFRKRFITKRNKCACTKFALRHQNFTLSYHLPMQEIKETVRSLGWEDPLEEEMAAHSSILPGASHGQRSLAGCSPQGHEELDTTEVRQTCSRHSVIYSFFCSTLWDSFIFYMSRETLILSVVYRLRWVTHHSWFIHPIHWFQLLLWAF